MKPALRPFRQVIPAAVRWTPSVVLLAAALGFGGMLLLGCANAEQRYRVLSFFFDGVPPPEGWTGPVDDALAAREQALAQAVEAEVQPVTWYHQPYVDRRCFDCHDREGTYATPDSGALMCRRCHDGYFEIQPNDWVHGPVAAGECSMCHEPHKSEHEHLLTLGQPALCFNCHDRGFIASDPFHASLGPEPVCADCHDPHAAGNRLLLADSRTWRQRTAVRRVERSSHAAWQRSDCARCHQVDQGNRVIEDVDRVCLDCHAPVPQQAQTVHAYAHEPVVEGRCTACHTPHSSPRPNLLLASAERMCLSCHDLSQVRTPQHPNVTRVDCTLCHAGHGSHDARLLRPALMSGRTEMQERAGP